MAGRDGGPVRLTVARHCDGATPREVVRKAGWPMVDVSTDEWPGDNGLPALGRDHSPVGHAVGGYARDDDGDGIREVHGNTREGLWTGLRNSLRPFRGVNKGYLYRYAAMFEWGYDVKRATLGFLWALLEVRSATSCPT